MTEQEKKEKTALLEKRKKGFDQNRTISTVALCLIGYDTWKSFKNNTPAWYFYLIMGVLLLALVGIIIRDSMQIKKAAADLKKVQEEPAEI